MADRLAPPLIEALQRPQLHPVERQTDPAQAAEAHHVAACLELISAASRTGKHSFVMGPPSQDLVAQIVRLLRTTGPVETKRLLHVAKVLLPDAPCSNNLLQAIEVVERVPRHHRQQLGIFCFRMGSGRGVPKSRLKMAQYMVANDVERFFAADHQLSRLCRAAETTPLAVADHWRLCDGLVTINADLEIFNMLLTTAQAVRPERWRQLLHQWLTSPKGLWLGQMGLALEGEHRRHRAQQMIVEAWQHSDIFLPPSFIETVARHLGEAPNNAAQVHQALRTSARLSHLCADELAATRIFTSVAELSPAAQLQLVRLIEATYTSAYRLGAPIDATLDADCIERFARLDADLRQYAWEVVQSLCNKAQAALPAIDQMTLVAGLTSLKDDMGLVQAICAQDEMRPPELEQLLVRLVDTEPDHWLDEAHSQLSVAHEFICIETEDWLDAVENIEKSMTTPDL